MKSIEELMREYWLLWAEADDYTNLDDEIWELFRSYLEQMLDELEMEEKKLLTKEECEEISKKNEGYVSPEEVSRVYAEWCAAYNQAVREQNQKIKKLKGEE